MKRHLSDSEPEMCDDYEECCSSPDTMQVSRKKRRGIIEKRRRDRINNCLVELRRLVPAAFEKQGSAKLEKAEILQMTVEHLRHLHSRDPRGFSDPFSPYGNTRAFLDYSVMGFRECAAEITHYLSSVEGLDTQESTKLRIIGHLENVLSQKELAINAAMAANAMPKVTAQTLQTPISVVSMSSMPAVSIPYAPLTPPRASPDNLSPPASFPTAEALPCFSVAFPMPTAPIISLAPTTVPTVFHPANTTGFKPVIQPPMSIVKTQRPMPLTVITSTATSATNKMTTFLDSPVSPPQDKNITLEMISSATVMQPVSPTKTPTNLTKTPFRPWAVTNNA